MSVLEELRLQTRGYGLLSITRDVESVVGRAGVSSGLCTVFVSHTSASLIIQENADPDVLLDLEEFFACLVPESRSFRHRAEGPDDMPAHIRSALTQTSLGIPIQRGSLVLGTWQGVYLWEHRSRPHLRRVFVQVLGSPVSQ